MNANRHHTLRTLLALCVVAGASLAAGCNLEMRDDSRIKPLEPSPVFADGRSARPLVPGTVPHVEGPLPDARLTSGFEENGQPTAQFPYPVTKELLERGRDRFTIYCSVCHGEDGNGQGMVVRRGFPAPPSYHIDRLRRVPVGHIYDVITNGYGIMYSYRERIPSVEDRWAVAAYVRALQYSQYAPATDVPPGETPAARSVAQ